MNATKKIVVAAVLALLAAPAWGQTYSETYTNITAEEQGYLGACSGDCNRSWARAEIASQNVADAKLQQDARLTALADALEASGAPVYSGTIADVTTFVVTYDSSEPRVLQSIRFDDGTHDTTYSSFSAEQLKWIPHVAASADSAWSAHKGAQISVGVFDARKEVTLEAFIAAANAARPGQTYDGEASGVTNFVVTYAADRVTVTQVLIEGD